MFFKIKIFADNLFSSLAKFFGQDEAFHIVHYNAYFLLFSFSDADPCLFIVHLFKKIVIKILIFFCLLEPGSDVRPESRKRCATALISGHTSSGQTLSGRTPSGQTPGGPLQKRAKL